MAFAMPRRSAFTSNRTGTVLTLPPDLSAQAQHAAAPPAASPLSDTASATSAASPTSATSAGTPRLPSLHSAMERLRRLAPLSSSRRFTRSAASPAPVTEFLGGPVLMSPMTPDLQRSTPAPALSPPVLPSPASVTSSESSVPTPRAHRPLAIGRTASTASHDSLTYSATPSNDGRYEGVTPSNDPNARRRPPIFWPVDTSASLAAPPAHDAAAALVASPHQHLPAATKPVAAFSEQSPVHSVESVTAARTQTASALSLTRQSADVVSDTSVVALPSTQPASDTSAPAAPTLPVMEHREFINWARLSERTNAIAASIAAALRCPPICCGRESESN